MYGKDMKDGEKMSIAETVIAKDEMFLSSPSS